MTFENTPHLIVAHPLDILRDLQRFKISCLFIEQCCSCIFGLAFLYLIFSKCYLPPQKYKFDVIKIT